MIAYLLNLLRRARPSGRVVPLHRVTAATNRPGSSADLALRARWNNPDRNDDYN
jgi:hypothetical protein